MAWCPRGDFPLQIAAAPFRLVANDKAKGKDKEKDAPPSTIAVVVGFKQPIRESAERMVENVDMQISAWDVDGRSLRQHADARRCRDPRRRDRFRRIRSVRSHRSEAWALSATRRGRADEF
jgi:hypothetical protein